MEVRTRFAPSPTGFLHVGGARTALFAWLFARRHGGKFVLRIEDTDLERSTAESVQAIFQGLEWLNLDWDEGPFYQMERMERYREIIQRLLDEGKAYRCYCSKDRLEDLRAKQLANKEKPRYDGLCLARNDFPPDQPYVIRFKNPRTGTVTIEDQVHGTIVFDNSELDDLIIARSDGTPTYNLTVVVDDMDMHITHVIRGAEHINNTPRQVNLLKALGFEPPIYAHMPIILGEDGKKLSKRHGAQSVVEYRDYGYLPKAMLNHLVRLGWSHGDQEIFTVDEMIKYFDIKDINKAAAVFNIDKLQWLNQHYMKTSPATEVAQQLKPQMEKLHLDLAQGPKLEDIVAVFAERCHTLVEMAQKSSFFYQAITEYDDKAKKELTHEIAPVLQEIKTRFAALESWERQAIHAVICEVAEQLSLKLGKIAQPLRAAMTGTTVSPPIDVTLELLGQERTLERIQNALERLGL